MKRVAFIVGETSGDRIGADLIRGLRARAPWPVEAFGLGGEEMRREGVQSLFDIDELSIIGVGAVAARLPQLLRRLSQTTAHVLAGRADALVIIDSPTFSHRVAKRVRKVNPSIPIVNYVPPTVWAWREHRAARMRAYVDHAICVLPFEPATMARLGGPPSTYVGHPVLAEPELAALLRQDVRERPAEAELTLLILPGSRRGEIARLMDDFGATLEFLSQRLPMVRAVLPAVARLRPEIERRVANWRVQPRIVGPDEKWSAFASADAALAASGTVSLELALAGVPMALAYKLDPIGYRVRHLVSGWTAALANYVVDHPLVPEHFHEFVRPQHLARRLERLITDTPERAAQIAGFRDIRAAMVIDRPPGEAAAEIVVELMSTERGSARSGSSRTVVGTPP